MVVPEPNQPVREYTWKEFDTDIKILAIRIRKKYPDLLHIYGIPRGGKIIAVVLSHRLGLEYVDNPRYSPKIYFGGKEGNEVLDKLLIVDDICDSGETIAAYTMRNTACLLTRITAIRKPKITGNWIRNKDWIIFPWEKK